MALDKALQRIPLLTEATTSDIDAISKMVCEFLDKNPSTAEVFEKFYMETIVARVPQPQVMKYGWYLDSETISDILKAHVEEQHR